ncbi:MAG: PAS domain-containing protein [Chthoniobacterales bacterium]
MKKTLLAAAVAAALATTTGQSPAADNAAEQLEDVTTAMNSIPDIIFYKDMDGVYRGGNSAWAALAGKPLDQLIGQTDFDLFPADVAKSFQSYDQAMLEAGQTRRNKEWLTYPDGRKVYVETLKTPWIGPDGKVLGVLGICHEITAPAGEKPAQEK